MSTRSIAPTSALLGLGVLIAAALGTADPAPAAGAPQSILAANPDSALAATLRNLPGETLLLSDALAEAAANASDARVAAARLTAAEQAVRREKGAFDPEIFGNAAWTGADTPSASLFAGAEVLQTETSFFEAGARVRTRLGTEVSASMNSLRTTSNSGFAALSPEYTSVGRLTLRQPLLKGFGPSVRSELAFAESTRAGAAARYDGVLLAVRAAVETAYWGLYAAERNHAVDGLIRDRAAAFLEDARARARAGMIGPSQVANAEFFLTEAEQNVLDSEEQLDLLSDRLASLMGRGLGGRRYRSADAPPRVFAVVDQDSLVAVALERSPDLQALSRDVEAARVLADGAVWDARPTLDLVGELGGSGLSGTAQDVYFPGSTDPVRTSVDGGRWDDVSQAVRRDYPNWKVGVVFALPLGNRQGKGERDRRRAEIVRAEQELLSARRGFAENVRAQHRELERGQLRLEIATRGVAASFRQVDIGMIEYRNGRATAFEVVRLAADLATAQQRYSDALVRTARAAAVLRQLTGGWYPGTEEN
ncbi:MAG: TolC family protein [bacterium]|nr:TolC family protein [bacterium]